MKMMIKARTVTMNKNKEKTESVRKWLKVLLKVSSHYCRSNTSRLYIAATFSSLFHMHKVYKEWCKGNEEGNIASRNTFVKI